MLGFINGLLQAVATFLWSEPMKYFVGIIVIFGVIEIIKKIIGR
jgi:hypothetical protein